MNLRRDTLNLISRFVLVGSALLIAFAFVLGGVQVGLGAIAGGVFAILDWTALRWLGERLMVANPRGRTLLGLLLAAKMALSLGAVAAILATRMVDPIGFVVGFSGLVVGIICGVFLSAGGGATAAAGGASEGEPDEVGPEGEGR
ncbi:MAG: hypothetical protein AB7S26_12445 [Sandaracinaceae bacterium]